MPGILNTVKPLIDRGTSLAGSALSNVPGPAGALGKRLAGGGGAKPGMDDRTLKSKVESTLFRVPGVSRSKVNVTVADGVVTVHGEAANQAQMATIETAVRAVPEVEGYESQLHLPKTPAPSTPKAGQRQAKAKKAASATKASQRGRTERVNRDKTTTSDADPAPADLAAKREGRKPAPMGSEDSGGSSDASSSPAGKAAGTQSSSAAAKMTSGSKPEGAS